MDGNFAYNTEEDGVERHHSDMLSPNYYVFAGAKDADGAAELVGQLGLAASLEEWVGRVTVVNPADGAAYTAADADAFVELATAAGPANNVKVIGVDEGADFVLGALAPKLYFVAGIMTYGGTKAGLMFGEMVVFLRPEFAEGLTYSQKQSLQVWTNKK